MIVALVGACILLCVVALVVAVARDPGPGPVDVAVAYEHAWDRLDFDVLWRLSGPALRAGRDRAAFVHQHRAAEHPGLPRRQLRRVSVERIEARRDGAVVVTTRPLQRDGTRLRNEVVVARREGGWAVESYTPLPAHTSGPA